MRFQKEDLQDFEKNRNRKKKYGIYWRIDFIIYKFTYPEHPKEMKKQKKQKSKGKTKTKTVTKPTKTKSRQKNEPLQQPQEKVQINIPYNFSDQGENLTIKLHNTYTVDKQFSLFNHMRNFYSLYVQKQKRKNSKLYKLSQFSYYPHFQFHLAKEKVEQNKCSICQFEFEDMDAEEMERQLLHERDSDVIVLKCSHMLHYPCFEMLVGEKEWFRCPVCSTISGKMIGDQPPGNMNTHINDHMHCEGYEDYGTIVIDYSMNPGKKGNINFPGTHRTAYLPNCPDGQEVLKLLQEAFSRKLIFTIGRSVTTGRDNQIVWNGVHHKTNLSGGSAYFGYPDPTYFDRIKLELAAKGIY